MARKHKDERPAYYKREELKEFTLYFKPGTYETLKEVVKALGFSSIQKALMLVIMQWMNEKLQDELKKKGI